MTRMKMISILFLLTVSLPSFAINLYGALGDQTLQERSQQQEVVDRRFQNYSLGVGTENWLSYLEFFHFQESTSSGFITIKRKVEYRALGGYFISPSWKWVSPLVGGGLGYSTEIIETGISSDISREIGRPNYFMYGSLGLKLDLPWIWLSGEIRVHGFEKYQPNPAGGVLCKIGLNL